MKTVYVVCWNTWEITRVVRGFFRKESAESFLDECIKYQKTMPTYPYHTFLNEEAVDPIQYNEYDEKMKTWKENHPAQHLCSDDDDCRFYLTYMEINEQ